MKMSLKSLCALLILWCALVRTQAANPSFNSFNTNQFTVTGNTISVNGAGLTNGPWLTAAQNLSDLANKRSASINTSLAVASPAGGNNFTNDAITYAPTFEGQCVVSYSGDKAPWLWFARGTSAGTNSIYNPFNFAQGINHFGTDKYMVYDPTGGQYGDHGNLHIYMNGSPAMASKNYVVNNNGAISDKYVYIWNMNPYDSGGGLSIPMIGTNPVFGSADFIASDGTPVVIENQFGFQLLSIGDAYPVGETNQAGNYVMLGNGPFGTYFSYNTALSGEPAGFNQHYWEGVDWRFNTNSSYPVKVHFPVQTAGVYTFTNANNHDIINIDESNGRVVINDWDQQPGQDETALLNVNGPATFNLPSNGNSPYGNNGTWTWDSGQAHRIGAWAKQGQYTKLAHGSGTPFIITRNTSGSDLYANATGNFSDELTIDASGNATFANSVTVNNGLTVASNTAPAAPANGVTFWVSNNAALYVRTTAGNKLITTLP